MTTFQKILKTINLQDFVIYIYSIKNTVNPLVPLAPKTNDYSISAVLDGHGNKSSETIFLIANTLVSLMHRGHNILLLTIMAKYCGIKVETRCPKYRL